MPITSARWYEVACDTCGKKYEPEGFIMLFESREEATDEINADDVEWRRMGRRVFCSDACEQKATKKSEAAGGER